MHSRFPFRRIDKTIRRSNDQTIKRVAIVAALAAMVATGCDKEARLNSNLEETQANLIVAALLDAGISAHKSPGDEGAWNVTVAESRFADAANLLDRKGLPRRAYNGVGEVFKKTGMVSSPTEERIRYMDALSQDLSRTLTSIDGIIDARVHVVLPNNDPFAKNVLPSSAAVAIRCRKDVDINNVLPQIKNLVLNSIEGLTYDKISVTVFRDIPAVVEQRLQAQKEDARQMADPVVLRWLVAVTAAAVVLLAGLAAVAAVLFFRLRRRLKELEKQPEAAE